MNGGAGQVLVIGADGQIGRALVAGLAARGHAALGTTRRRERAGPERLHLDLEDGLQDWRPPEPVAAAVLAAAITKLDACERDPSATARVNVEANLALADRLAALGTYVIFLSTNQVFDGTRPHRLASEPTSPRTQYGRQKAEVERRLLQAHPTAAVLRLTKVVTPGLALLNGWVEALRSKAPIRPFRDVMTAPVPVSLVVEAVARMVEQRPAGVMQVSGPRDVAYADVALHIARRVGADEALVQPHDSSDAGLPAMFAPRHTTLDTTRLQQELGLIPPDAWSAVDAALTLDPLEVGPVQ